MSNSIYSDSVSGDVICKNCGLVIESHIFSSIENNKSCRIGSPISFAIHDKGLSTMIDWKDKDALGNKLSPKMKEKIFRLRKWHLRMRIHSSIDRNLAYAMNELDRLASQIDISSSIKETAALIYRKAVEKNLIRGRSIDAMVTASIYAACRMRTIPITIEELSRNTRLDKILIGRCFRLLLLNLNLKFPSFIPENYIPRFIFELKLSQEVQLKSLEIIKKAKAKGIFNGRDPVGLAAASIYISSIIMNEKRTQKEIAEIAKITEVTIRNRSKEIIEKLNLNLIHTQKTN